MASEVARPSSFARWATTVVVDPVSNAPNIVVPTESKQNVGWARAEPPPRNYMNWMQNLNYQWQQYLDYRVNTLDVITDGNGSLLFPVVNTIIMLWAVDKTSTGKYIVAMGWRGATTPALNVISSATLTLGSGGSDGSQAISGATASNIIVRGLSFK